MPAGRFNAVIFDLDGTLADTAPDLAASLNHMLRQFGRDEVSLERVCDMIGNGVAMLVRRGLAATGEATEALVERALPIFYDHYRAHLCVGTRAYPGVEAALEALSGAGSILGVCTNKPEGLARGLIEALGWTRHFQAVIGGDTLDVRKPDPAPLLEAIARCGGRPALLVGDSMTDAETARAAGIPFVAVSFGFSDRPVGELGADAVIDHFETLPIAIAAL